MSAVHYAVRHETLYRYRRDVVHAHQQLHLTPRNSERQHCVLHRIDITPQPAVAAEYVDAFGNWVTRVELDRPHRRLQVVAEMDVRLDALPEFDFKRAESWERVREQLCYSARERDAEWLEAMRFRGESPYVHIKGVFGDYARDCLIPKASVPTVCAALMAKMRRDFTYAPGATEIATPLLQVLANRAGVCQDFAHLMIACLRSAGLSARYVSGYLRTHGPGPASASEDDEDDEDDDADEPRSRDTAAVTAGAGNGEHPDKGEAQGEGIVPPLRGADASHAWVAVFAPPFGWIGFDPTNNVIANQDHVALAWGRDFGDVSPLRGVILGGGSHRLTVRVAVRRIDDPA
ncbi:MAG TPA: transglutaminase family protein [Steroidobacteraceae bacterium]|jgi:transglutaminase-like putative cysteine protease|nr:transglutaminase family protein [Steroidobacteraceae bacterium]